MSPSWKTAAAATFSRRPLDRSSSTCTSTPRARSASTTCEPMKPAPPVTNARMPSPSGGFEASLSHCRTRMAATPLPPKTRASVRDQADQGERRHPHQVSDVEQFRLLDRARKHEHEPGCPAIRPAGDVVNGGDGRLSRVCRDRDLLEAVGKMLQHDTRSVP